MLVRLRGTAENIDGWDHRLSLTMPPLFFDNTDYNISLRSIFVSLTTNLSTAIPHQHWSLQTTMVDRCDVNPHQVISTFVSTKSESFIYHEPAAKQEYKIQLTSLLDSEFILTSLKKEVGISIDFIEILLEFSRYARI